MRPRRYLVIDEVSPYPAGLSADPIPLWPRIRAAVTKEVAMRLREKGKKDAPIITLSWDEAQTALAAGTHEPVNEESDEGKDRTDEVDDDDLDGKTRPELEAIAKDRNVDVSQAKTKDDVLKALRAKA